MAPPHTLLPRFGRTACIDSFHSDAVFHRAHQPAEIAAYAFVFIDAWDAFRWGAAAGAVRGIELGDGGHGDARAAGGLQAFRHGVAPTVNALVRAIPAGDVTQVAADARVGIDARHDAVIQ